MVIRNSKTAFTLRLTRAEWRAVACAVWGMKLARGDFERLEAIREALKQEWSDEYSSIGEPERPNEQTSPSGLAILDFLRGRDLDLAMRRHENRRAKTDDGA